MKCPKCGSENITDDGNYCFKCGHWLSSEKKPDKVIEVRHKQVSDTSELASENEHLTETLTKIAENEFQQKKGLLIEQIRAKYGNEKANEIEGNIAYSPEVFDQYKEIFENDFGDRSDKRPQSVPKGVVKTHVMSSGKRYESYRDFIDATYRTLTDRNASPQQKAEAEAQIKTLFKTIFSREDLRSRLKETMPKHMWKCMSCGTSNADTNVCERCGAYNREALKR